MKQSNCTTLPDDFSITLAKSEVSRLSFTERTNGDLRCRLIFDAKTSSRLPGSVNVGVNRYGEILVTDGDSLIVQGDTHKWVSLDAYANGLNKTVADGRYVSIMVNGGSAVLLVPKEYQG